MRHICTICRIYPEVESDNHPQRSGYIREGGQGDISDEFAVDLQRCGWISSHRESVLVVPHRDGIAG